MDDSGPLSLNLEKIADRIQALTKAKQLWVAYSGGIDSHVLLDLVVTFFSSRNDYTIHALHIHHGISPHADAWATHCEKVCSDLKVPLTVLHVDGNVVGGRSPEEVAREARFAAFEGFLEEGACLLLAHHETDQAETILLRLFRGAGPLGLGGMPEKAVLGKAEMIKPLLNVDKSEILHYAHQKNLVWVEDDSNINIRYDRNFLRHEIMPILIGRWPRVIRSINRAGSLCLETAHMVNSFALNDLESVREAEPNHLSVSRLLKLDTMRRRGVIRCWLQSLGYALPSLDHMQRINREVLNAKLDSRPKLKISDYVIRRVRDVLIVEPYSL